MALALLDKKYELIRCLHSDGRSQVFLATDPHGIRKAVKFVEDPESFFEELARHYACESIAGVNKLCDNYPPFSMSGQRALMDPEIAAILRRNGEEKAAAVGALVFEFIDGLPLGEVLAENDDLDRVERLMLLAELLSQVHAQGEFHGRVNDDHVLLDVHSGEVKMVGFSGSGHNDVVNGSKEDVRQFAAYLRHLEKPGQALSRLIERCERAAPTRRPTMKRVHKALRDHWVQMQRPWFHAPATPLAATAVLLLCLHFFWTPQKTEIDAPVSETVGALANGVTLEQWLKPQIHGTVHFSEELQNRVVDPRELDGLNWRDALDQLEIPWNVSKQNGETILKLGKAAEEGAPES